MKIVPDPTPSVSYIELAAKSTKSTNFWLKFWGYLCIPACCVGCVCLGVSLEIGEIALLYSKLVDFYGGVIIARQMANRIRIQKQIFKEAVIHVNNTFENIDPNLTIFDLVRKYNHRFNAVFAQDTLESMFNSSAHYTAYYKAVWDTFIEMQGNPNTVIYGFIECILENVDPTSLKAIYYAKLIINNISLRNEMEKAGRK